jgi:hypothetical protein
VSPSASPASPRLDDALAQIAASATERDREATPRFPDTAVALLERHGALAWNAKPGPARPAAALELNLVRQVAAADGSVGRICDGHLNAVERLTARDRDRDRRRRSPARREDVLLRWYGREGVVVGVLAHEADEDYERGRSLIAHGTPWS